MNQFIKMCKSDQNIYFVKYSINMKTTVSTNVDLHKTLIYFVEFVK